MVNKYTKTSVLEFIASFNQYRKRKMYLFSHDHSRLFFYTITALIHKIQQQEVENRTPVLVHIVFYPNISTYHSIYIYMAFW